jgi:hypothetical protein
VSRVPGLLRTSALVAAIAGAGGSLGFLLHANRHPPPLLLVIMSTWVIGPFVALMVAGAVSKHWPSPVQTTLDSMMFVVALGTLGVYTADALNPPKAQAAFVFVVVPLVSSVLTAIAVATAAVRSRGQG